MRLLVQKWLVVLLLFFGVPIILIWALMPFIDISRATYLTSLHQYRQAIALFDRALWMNGALAKAYGRRGELYAKLKQPGHALVDLNRAITLSPDDWEAYNNRAAVLLEGGQLEQASVDAAHATQLCSECPYPYDTLGMILAQQGNTAQAMQMFNKAIELNPKYGAALFHRGKLEETLGQSAASNHDLKVAEELHYEDQ